MFEDHDMKIAGTMPSKDLKSTSNFLNISEEYNRERENGNIFKAKELGRKIAGLLNDSDKIFPHDEEDVNAELKSQKETLLAFSTVATLEMVCPTSATSYAAQNSFYSALEMTAPEIYKNTLNSGAFSFYYLAFRRSGEIERRIGQTFAMLCSHDGDPVYQELGEAIYCWFASIVEEEAAKIDFI
ncbi:MAG: hypothetical protein IJW78_05600 [Clostridia bacterium]|nr:hypothetical protein [Clostridia bacterium]MBQ7289180.1 hypothetical protein [Clostridia bacterium]